MYRAGFFDHHTPDLYASAVAATAAPVAQDFLGPVPQGYCWYLEAWTSHIGAAHTAVCELAVSPTQQLPAISANWDRGNRLWFSGAAAADFSPLAGYALYIPEGYYLIAYWTAGGGTLVAGDTCLLTTQIAWHQLSVKGFMSPEDIEQARASHEHPQEQHERASHEWATGELAV